MSKTPEERALEMTQRLDHMVPDPKISAARNQEAAAELAAISAKLNALLPDHSLSPLERLERLARVVEDRQPDASQLKPAVEKVEEIKARLSELVPGEASPDQKLDILVSKLNDLVPLDAQGHLALHKLEMLGDPRGRVEPE